MVLLHHLIFLAPQKSHTPPSFQIIKPQFQLRQNNRGYQKWQYQQQLDPYKPPQAQDPISQQPSPQPSFEYVTLQNMIKRMMDQKNSNVCLN